MKNLDIDLLRTFVAVVEQESFAGAANAVSRSQSAVTQQMQRLEDHLGRPLFRRSGRHKALTEDGIKTLAYARRLLTLNDEAWHAITGAAIDGEVRLGAPHDIADTILPNVLAHFSRHFPALRVSIHMGRSPHLIQDLLRGEIDLTMAAMDAPGLRYLTLRTSPIVWMCASDYRHDPALPLPLIVADELSFFRRIAIEHLDLHGVPWRIHYTSSTLVGVKAAVKAGLGVTARSVEMLGPDIRVLGEVDALPRLPDVSFRLYLGPTGKHQLAQRLFDSLQHRSL